jgi:hypothetical protein
VFGPGPDGFWYIAGKRQGVIVVMKLRMLVGALISVALLLGAGTGAIGQESGSTKTQSLRVEWELQSARGAYRNFCGRVYNEREVPARHVVILFEGFDGAGLQVSRRFGEVIGDVPASSYSIFCLLVPDKGTTYRVTVPGVDWGFNAP